MSNKELPRSGDTAVRVLSEETGEIYVTPQAENLPTVSVDEATQCACSAGDDNPWPR